MAENEIKNLSGVPETLLFPLYVRALETQRPDALLKDEKAAALIERLPYDFSRIQQIKMDKDDQVTLILRNREFDGYARDFLLRHPDAVVVHIGCGLDSRFTRVDNGTVDWYDLDVPEVIELRKKYLGDEEQRYHYIASSAFDLQWLERLKRHSPRTFLFLAEGVFMYFPEEQIKTLVLALHDQFPGSELIFDVFTPFLVRMNNIRFLFTNYGVRYRWGLKHGRDLEEWADGIHLLDEWSYFDRPEPRLDHIRWMRNIPFLARVMSIYHYQLS